MVAAVAEETGKSKADVKEILEALIAQVVKTVKAGDEIALIGFGTFKSAERAARTGRNPATGKEIKILASIQPKFVAGKMFVAGYGLGTTFPVPRNRLRFFKFGLPGQPLISRDRLALQFSRFFSLFPC